MRKYYTISQAYRTIGLIVIVLSVLFYLLVTPDERDTIQETIIERALLRDALKNILPGEATENINIDSYSDIYIEVTESIDLSALNEEYKKFVIKIKDNMTMLQACTISSTEVCLGEKKHIAKKVNGIEISANCLYTGGLLNNKRHGPGHTLCNIDTDTNISQYGYYLNDYPNNEVYEFEINNSENMISISRYNYIGGLPNSKAESYIYESVTENIVYVHIGDYKDGLFSGQGIELTSDSIYKGQWKEGRYHGQGKKKKKIDDESYQGAFLNGYYHGFGTWQNRDEEGRENIYHGDLALDWAHGQGMMIWANGEKYNGSWDKDYFHGQGTHTYENGKKISGHFNEGSLDDPAARLEYKDGSIYIGGFVGDILHGRGIHTDVDGSSTVENWTNGYMNGDQIFKNKEGTFYESYKYDVPHGNFKNIYNDGEIKTYRMENGVVVGSVRIVTTNGKTYDCDNNEMNCKQVN